MRILVATDQWFPDHVGGLARVAADSARGLAALGHDVVVLAPVGAESTEDPPGVLVERVLQRSRLPQTVTDAVGTFRAARGRRGQFDVAVAHTSTTAAGLVAARLDAPLVYVFHASAPLELRFLRTRLASRAARLRTYPLEALLLAQERTALRAAARVLVLSAFSRGLVEGIDGDAAARVRQVGGGVDVHRFCPNGGIAAARARVGVETSVPLLVAVRRLEPRMGLEQLVDAVAQFEREGMPVDLALVGGGNLRGALEQQIEALDLRSRVRVTGRVPDHELPDWYRAADLCVLPTVAYEGFGLATAEALACGTPVVGTPVGATPELLRPLDPRLVAAGSSSEDLHRAIGGALEFAPALRARAASYAREQFGWSQVIAGWDRALADVVEDAA